MSRDFTFRVANRRGKRINLPSQVPSIQRVTEHPHKIDQNPLTNTTLLAHDRDIAEQIVRRVYRHSQQLFQTKTFSVLSPPVTIIPIATAAP